MAYNPQPLFQDAIETGSLGAVNDTAVLILSNASGAIVNISGTWSGTILFDGTNDDFVTTQNASVFTPPSGIISAGVTTGGYYRFVAVSGFTKIRARMSIYNSGTAVVVLSASIGSGLAPTVSVNHESMLTKSKLTGGTDNTTIGNIGDRLKTTSSITSIASGVNAFTQNLIYDDMNVSTGGIARGANVVGDNNWVRLYSYTGNGVYTGFSLALSNANNGWNIRLVLDSTKEIFGSNGISTTDLDNNYGMFVGTQNSTTYGIGFGSTASFIYHSSPTYNPIRFDSKIEIYVRRASQDKAFNAGLIVLTKEV